MVEYRQIVLIFAILGTAVFCIDFFPRCKNHIKIYSVEYRQIVLNFLLLGTAVLHRFFFPRCKIFFLFHNIIEVCSPKWKAKKLKQKSLTKPIKKNYKKNHKSIRNKNSSKRKKEYIRNYCYKRKNKIKPFN